MGGANQDRNLDRAWKYGDTLSPLYYAFRHCLVWRGHDSSMTSADAAGRFAMSDCSSAQLRLINSTSMAPTVITLPDNLDLPGFISCSSLFMFPRQLMTHNS